MNKPVHRSSFNCCVCGTYITRVGSHRFQNKRYCDDCWALYQEAWEYNLYHWLDSYGDNIKSLDCYKPLKGKGYYITSDGDVYRTLKISRAPGKENFTTSYLPTPIKLTPSKRRYNVSFGDNSITYYVKDMVYTAFNGTIPNGFIVVHIDHDKSNNALSNLVLIPRMWHSTKKDIYYAVKNGQRLTEAMTAEQLAEQMRMEVWAVHYLCRTGKRNKHGIYVKKL